MLRKTLVALAIASSFGSASAALLTFDDVPGGSTSNYVGALPTYMGYTFGSIGSYYSRLDWIDTVGSSWNYGSVSGEHTMLNNYGGDGVIRAADNSDFTFDGLWARNWGNWTSERAVSIVGMNNGQVVWSQYGTLNPSWAQFSGMSGAIDELRLNLGNHFLVDNLALSATVPEPTSLLLAGLGLAALGGARRRRALSKA